MARLGSVLGGVLAELARARVIADRLTSDLVAEYEGDPILRTLSVPRVTVRSADLALRFTVRAIEEEEPRDQEPGEALESWQEHAIANVFTRTMARMKLTPQETRAVISTLKEAGSPLFGRPTIADMRRALAGDPARVLEKATRPMLEHFQRLPKATRDKVGGKLSFQRKLTADLRNELTDFVNHRIEAERIRAALASRIDIAIARDELPEDPALMQEIRLTLHGDDLDLFLSESSVGEG